MNSKYPTDGKDLIIIGGGAVGLAVATSIARHSNYKIVVFSSDTHASYSQCGIPFALAGEISGLNSLLLRRKEFFEEVGIDLRTSTVVDSICINRRTIKAHGQEYAFDKLVIATGSKPTIPEELKEGAGLENVHTLRTFEDGSKLNASLIGASNAIVIGGGSIGVEIAVACARRGIKTLLVTRNQSILPHNMDPDMAQILQEHLENIGVHIITDKVPSSINGDKKVSSVTIEDIEFPADVVIISTGVRPETKLASDAGIALGETGGMIVNEKLQVQLEDGTFDSDIYCGGECAQLQDLITGRPTLSQLASTARRMAEVIRDNLISKDAKFGPVLGPWVCLIGEMEAGSVGLTTHTARQKGIDIVSGIATGTTSAGYYPGSGPLYIKLLFSKRTLVGAQVIGAKGVKERIDGLSLAIQKRTTVEEIMGMETCYTPPLATLVDPISIAAKGAIKKMPGL